MVAYMHVHLETPRKAGKNGEKVGRGDIYANIKVLIMTLVQCKCFTVTRILKVQQSLESQ